MGTRARLHAYRSYGSGRQTRCLVGAENNEKVGATSLIVKRRDENDEIGMLLFSDVAKEVIAKDRAPERVNVYEIMAKPVLTVRPDMEIRYCARMFVNFGITHAPVVENDKIVGIVSYYLLVLHGMLPDLD